MSRYVVLILAECNDNEALIQRQAIGPRTCICALTVSNNPRDGLSTLQSYCPVPLQLLHVIESASRTGDLERTLHIKYKAQQLQPRSFWFILTPEDIAFIQAINNSNLTKTSGLIKRSLMLPPAPVITPETLPDFIQEQLDLCQKLIT